MLLNHSAKISSRFTDKVPFFDDLSVKTGPKQLNFYGQAAIFNHFVRIFKQAVPRTKTPFLSICP